MLKKDKCLTKKDEFLTKIPLLGFIFRFIKENREAIEKTLKTGEETTKETKGKYFMFGLFRLDTWKRFNILKFKRQK